MLALAAALGRGAPSIESCSASVTVTDDLRVEYTAGANCESVILELYKSGVLQASYNRDTTPFATKTEDFNLADGSYNFKVRPFNLDGQEGVEGPTCTTSSAVIDTSGGGPV